MSTREQRRILMRQAYDMLVDVKTKTKQRNVLNSQIAIGTIRAYSVAWEVSRPTAKWLLGILRIDRNWPFEAEDFTLSGDGNGIPIPKGISYADIKPVLPDHTTDEKREVIFPQ